MSESETRRCVVREQIVQGTAQKPNPPGLPPSSPAPALPAGIADAQHAAMAGWCVQPASPLQDPASSQWPLLSGHDPIDATLGYILSLGDPPLARVY